MKNTICPYNEKIICSMIDPENRKDGYYPCADCEHYPYQPDTPESVKLETKSVLKAGALILLVMIGGFLALWGLSEFIKSLRP